MNYMIRNASEYVLSLLETHPHGKVHSVYRRTVNLLLRAESGSSLSSSHTVCTPAADGQSRASVGPSVHYQSLHTPEVLVALQAAGSPMSPVSLITELSAEEMAVLEIRAGRDVSVNLLSGHAGMPSASTISIMPDCSFCVRTDRPVDLLLRHSLPEQDLALLEQNIRGALSLRDAGSFELLFTAPERAGEIFFLTAAQKRLEEAHAALEQKQYGKAARSLARLIGLGSGLTPGGDDFLCGALAGLTLCGLNRHAFAAALRCEISSHLEDTNKISAAFLTSALENQFSQAINELHPCCNPEKILHVFREIGHSSGTDSLCGVFFILLLRNLL